MPKTADALSSLGSNVSESKISIVWRTKKQPVLGCDKKIIVFELKKKDIKFIEF